MLSVVIVDDDVLILHKLTGFLSEIPDCRLAGTAMNGLNGLELVKEKKPHLLITDIDMPGKSGVELARSIFSEKLPVWILALSNYDNFEYVRSMFQYGSIDYILKHELTLEVLEEKIHSLLEKNTDRLSLTPVQKEQSFNLSEYLTEDSDHPDQSARFHDIDQNAGQRALICFYADNMFPVFGLKDEDVLQKNVLNVCTNMLQNVSLGYCTYMGQGLFVIFMKEKSNSSLYFTQAIHQLMAIISNRLFLTMQLRIQFEYSLFHGTLSNIREYYPKLRARIEENIFHVQTGERTAISQLDLEHQLLNALYRKDVSKIGDIIDHFFSVSWQNGIGTFYSTCRTLNHLAERSNVSEKNRSTAAESGNFKEYYCKMFCFITENDPIVSQQTYSPYVRETISLIDQQFDKDISLTVIAAQLHISEKYLSRLFRSETGESFKNYLRNKRLEIAKNLLDHTDLSINEIAIRTGFNTPNYFIQTFKAVENVTPKHYKNR